MLKNGQAKNSYKAKEKNKTEEHSNTRRVNTSINQQNNSHRCNSSKSKSKKKKKKSTHMKSQSNIPIYANPQFWNKGSEKKQYSDSKSKKKKLVKHDHHQSEANFSTSKLSNNILMIDGAIGIKAFINLQSISPQNNKAIVIPSTNVVSTNQMVKGGVKENPTNKHKRTLSDNYSYSFVNNNHIYASGPSTQDGRLNKLQSKDKKIQNTYDTRKAFISPNVQSKFRKSKKNSF